MCLHSGKYLLKGNKSVLSLLALLFDENGQHALNHITFFELARDVSQSIIDFVVLDHDIVEDG